MADFTSYQTRNLIDGADVDPFGIRDEVYRRASKAAAAHARARKAMEKAEAELALLEEALKAVDREIRRAA